MAMLLARSCVAAAALLAVAAQAQTVFTTSGANAAAIQGTVDTFRGALGPLNPNVAGSFGSGRREINWDGVPDSSATPTALAGNFFNVNSPRGAVFGTPGTLAVSAGAVNPTSTAVEFGNTNPFYSVLFAPFSAQRLFSAVGSNVVDVSFFVPGSTTAALTRGFGAVFSDVDLANVSSLTFFDAANVSLGTFFVATDTVANEGFSFLGVAFAGNVVSRVRIVAGNTALGPNETDSVDVVVMDDFIYGEPGSAAVTAIPEPHTYGLLVAGFGALAWVGRRRRVAFRKSCQQPSASPRAAR